MQNTAAIQGFVQCVTALLQRGGPTEGGFVRFAYRPFDTRWLYWEADSQLLDRPRPEYSAACRCQETCGS